MLGDLFSSFGLGKKDGAYEFFQIFKFERNILVDFIFQNYFAL